MFAALSHLCS